MATGRYLRFDLTICRLWKPSLPKGPMTRCGYGHSKFDIYSTYHEGHIWDPHFKGRRGRRGSISYYWKQRWWFPTLHYHHTFGRNLSSNFCDVQFNMGMDGSLLKTSNLCDHDTLTSRTDGRTSRQTDRRLAVAVPRSIRSIIAW